MFETETRIRPAGAEERWRFSGREAQLHHIKETRSIDSFSSPTEETPVGLAVHLGKVPTL